MTGRTYLRRSGTPHPAAPPKGPEREPVMSPINAPGPEKVKRLRAHGSPLMRRSLFAGLVVVGFVGGGAAVAAVPSPDPCDSSFTAPMNSFEKLKAYDACRFDRLETKVDAL